MGNRAKPSKLKVLEGNPGKRPINDREPEPPPGTPLMPHWLSGFPVAVEEWNREVSILVAMGIMTVADVGAMAKRCYMASQIQELALDLRKEGRVAYTQKMDSLGNEIMEAKANPKAIQLKNLLTEYRLCGSEFGFNPSARSKLTVNSGGGKSKFDGLVTGPSKKRG